MKNLNKKVLCFVDEYGTAGTGPFFLGCVIVQAQVAGRIDKLFSDVLDVNANEIHAADLDDGYLQSLLHRFWMSGPNGHVVLINHEVVPRGGSAQAQYAQAVIETIKIGLKRFQADVLRRATIGNVDVILDANHHNDHPAFADVIARARRQDGRFRAVNRVSTIDSASSRLLQLADVVAYSRKWIRGSELNAAKLRERFGIQMP